MIVRNRWILQVVEEELVSSTKRKRQKRKKGLDHHRGYKCLFEEFLSCSCVFESLVFVRVFGIYKPIMEKFYQNISNENKFSLLSLISLGGMTFIQNLNCYVLYSSHLVDSHT